MGVVLGSADLMAESLVKLSGGRAHEIEICKDAARRDERIDLAEQRPLARIVEVMDRQPGDNSVKRSHLWEGRLRSCWRSSTMGSPANLPDARASIGSEESSPIACASVWSARTSASIRPVAGAEVEEPIYPFGKCLQQHLLGGLPVRYLA